METIGEAARRLLQGLERAAKARETAFRQPNEPGEIEKPTGNAGDAQPVGNTRAEGGEPHGLEKLASGVAGIERFPGFREGHMRPLATDADSNATEFTVLLRGSNAHRVIGCNDNRAHAGTSQAHLEPFRIFLMDRGETLYSVAITADDMTPFRDRIR